MNQSEYICNKKWDVLFILDACRYDIFKKVYREFFKECVLEKVISPSTFTYGWLVETFGNRSFDDVVFVSSDYEVANSKGIRPGGGSKVDIKDIFKRIKYNNCCFEVEKKFYKIIDVWEYGVDKKLGVVHPETMINETEKVLKKYPHHRVITFFWQVHDPYLFYLQKGEVNVVNLVDVNMRNKVAYRLQNVKQLVSFFLSDETQWMIRSKLGFPPSNGIAETWYKYGRQGVIKGYVEDLKLVLQYIKSFADSHRDKKIMITSDHGELLGEKGRYSHDTNRYFKVLKEVPWCEIPKRF